jgi:hypothetical protein
VGHRPPRRRRRAGFAEIVGIPYDTVSQVGMFPVAYTIGTDFKPAKREPASTFLHWDTW